MLQAMFIMLLVVSLAAIALPWTIETIGLSMELAEFKSINSQFVDCNEKIIETARTGSTNKCIFTIKKGEITGKKEGIYYKLLSTSPLCDESPLVEIDSRNHIWQECGIYGKQRVYGLLWKFPSSINVTGSQIQGNKLVDETINATINFDPSITFDTLTLFINFQYQPGQTGSIVELSRIDVTQTNVTLKIKIY